MLCGQPVLRRRAGDGVQLATGKLIVGVTIPPEFAEDIARRRTVQVQVLYDAVDANTALPPATLAN